jgi:hypothetical protein
MNCLRWRLLALLPLILMSSAWAHDVTEIGLSVYLHTNRVELNVVLVRPTIMRAADAQGVHLLDFSRPDERENAMPVLRAQGAELFTLRMGTNTLKAAAPVITLGEDDHVSFRLTYPTPTPRGTNDLLRLEARILSHLPAAEGYGVSVTVLDKVRLRVVEQALLKSGSQYREWQLPALPAGGIDSSATKTP